MGYATKGAKRLRSALLSGTVVLALTAAGCSPAPSAPTAEPISDDWETIVEAAKAEGTVTFYTSQSQATVDRMLAGWAEEYPEIAVDLYRSPTGAAMPERLENEIASNSWRADVVQYGDKDHIQSVLDRGFVETDPGVPAAAAWPEIGYYDGMAEVALTVFTIVYNTDLVTGEDIPEEWEDVLDPQWKGQIAILDPITPAFQRSYQFLANEYGEEFLGDLADQDPTFYQSGNSMGEAVAAGEFPIGLFTYTHAVETLKGKGAPVERVETPTTPYYGNPMWVASSENVSHPNAARVFLNFFMSQEGQEVIAGEGRGTSHIDVPGMIPPPPDGLAPTDIEVVNQNYDEYRELIGLPPL